MVGGDPDGGTESTGEPTGPARERRAGRTLSRWPIRTPAKKSPWAEGFYHHEPPWPPGAPASRRPAAPRHHGHHEPHGTPESHRLRSPTPPKTPTVGAHQVGGAIG